MVIEIEKSQRPVVHCLRCRRPIPVPAASLSREESPEAGESELRSHLLLLWCRICGKESLYLLDDVVEADATLASGR